MSKNIIVQRMSGNPVLMDQLDAYKAEFQSRYDQIQAEVGLDMQKFHECLIKLDEELNKKYSLKEEFPLPKSQKAWHELITKFECPVMLAKSAENPKQLIMVLMDRGLG